jgi:hypothetical protein
MSRYSIATRKFAKGEEGAIDHTLFIGLIGALCILAVAAIGVVLKHYHLEIGHHSQANLKDKP